MTRDAGWASGRDGHDAVNGVTQALGWFSLGLGAVQVLAPRMLSRRIGVRRSNPLFMRMLGAREIVTGVGILSRRKQSPWLWGRVAGDVMDIALLGMATRTPRNRQERLIGAAAAVAGVTGLDLWASRRARAASDGVPVRVAASVTVKRSAEDLYRFWSQLENLPRIMRHLQSVTTTGARRSHWVAAGPGGTTVEWDAETVETRPAERIGWRSMPDATVTHEGSVRFVPAPGGRGTEVRVELAYRPPADGLGATAARLLGRAPEQEIREDLRRFKQFMETGEIPRAAGDSHTGRILPHAAQPHRAPQAPAGVAAQGGAR